jgi:hypothetical protein
MKRLSDLADLGGSGPITLRKALFTRMGLILGGLAVFFGIIALTPGYKPWFVLIPVFGTFGVIMSFVATFADRKVLVRAGKGDAPWSGAMAASVPVDAPISPDRALEIAKEALGAVGATGIEAVDDHTIVGWSGTPWVYNVPSLQAYQLAVAVVAQSEASTQILCCARPRFANSAFGNAMSQRIAVQLQAALLERV